MICFIACDTECNLGAYFDLCAKDCSDILNEFDPILMQGSQLNQVHVDIRLKKRGNDNFIFAAYSHGVEDALKVRGEPYVKVGINTQLFSKGLVYTNACLTAQELGPDLIEHGAFAFVGYNEEVPVIRDEIFQEISRNADNYALTLFLNGETIGDSVESTKNYLSSIIELKEPYLHKAKYIEISNLYRAELIEIRDAMKVRGDESLTISDLMTE